MRLMCEGNGEDEGIDMRVKLAGDQSSLYSDTNISKRKTQGEHILLQACGQY